MAQGDITAGVRRQTKSLWSSWVGLAADLAGLLGVAVALALVWLKPATALLVGIGVAVTAIILLYLLADWRSSQQGPDRDCL
jgi:hypothetical protein